LRGGDHALIDVGSTWDRLGIVTADAPDRGRQRHESDCNAAQNNP